MVVSAIYPHHRQLSPRYECSLTGWLYETVSGSGVRTRFWYGSVASLPMERSVRGVGGDDGGVVQVQVQVLRMPMRCATWVILLAGSGFAT